MIRWLRRFFWLGGFIPGDRVVTKEFMTHHRTGTVSAKKHDYMHSYVFVEWDKGEPYYIHPDNIRRVEK